MDRKPDIFEKIAYLGIAIATAKMYVDLHSGRIHSSLGPVLSFFIDFALYYIIYRIGRFVWCSWIRGRTRQEVKKQIEQTAQESSDPSYKVHFPNKLQALYDYAFSHIGHLLEEDEKAELTRNIRSFATSDAPDLSPILKRRIEGLGLYDLYHLCHAIGYHTGRVKNGSDVAHFIKVCFPAYTLGVEESTIRCKLTYIDCDYKIPVVPKKADISQYCFNGEVISG